MATRTTALSLAGVMLRVWTPLAVVAQHPTTGAAARAAVDRAYVWMPFVAWVPNLIVAEWAIRRRATGARRLTAAPSGQ